jgi:hypothetical protein
MHSSSDRWAEVFGLSSEKTTPDVGDGMLISCITSDGGHSMTWPSGLLPVWGSWSSVVAREFVEAIVTVDRPEVRSSEGSP